MTDAGAELDRLPCGVLAIGADRTIRRCNRRVLELLSFASTDHVTGRDIGEIVSMASRILLDSYVYPMLLEAGVADEVQLTLKSPSGDAHPIVADFRMNADRTVDCVFMGCANRDQLYTELLDTRDRLEEQTRTLGQLNDRIRERQSDLQAFCESLSHDFTSPLGLIHQFVGMALEDLRESGIEAPDEFRLLENAQQNAATLVGLAKGLVAYLVADVAVARDERVDLEQVVSAVLAMREHPGEKAPVVHRRALPILHGNGAQIQVLFKNLIENAIKYNERDPEITITHARDTAAEGRVVISVSDNGIGMSDAHRDRAFEPFVRLNAGDRYRGSGLGLSIVRKMVTNHGGDIRVESAPGVGSTFHVSLPLDVSAHGASGASGA